MMPLAMWMPGPTELVLIAIVALLLFGRQLPERMKGIGKSIKALRQGLREADEDA